MTSSRPVILRLCLIAGMAALLLAGCRPSVPRQYIQPGQMENLLYEYHLSMTVAANERTTGADIQQLQAEYRQEIFRKHGITQQDFDKSMAYYYRHADRLKQMYGNIGRRLSNQAAALGVNVAKRGRELPTTGDTANVWNGDENILLMPYRPHNLYTFSIKADSSYHAGDKVELNFNATFIYQDGPHDATAYIVVRFNNDSTATQMRRLNNTADYSMAIADNNKAGIKQIQGYFIMPQALADPGTSSYRVVSLHNVHMVRTHPTSKPVDAEQKTQQTVISSGSDAPDLVRAAEGEGEQLISPDNAVPVDHRTPQRAQSDHQWKTTRPAPKARPVPPRPADRPKTSRPDLGPGLKKERPLRDNSALQTAEPDDGSSIGLKK